MNEHQHCSCQKAGRSLTLVVFYLFFYLLLILFYIRAKKHDYFVDTSLAVIYIKMHRFDLAFESSLSRLTDQIHLSVRTCDSFQNLNFQYLFVVVSDKRANLNCM